MRCTDIRVSLLFLIPVLCSFFLTSCSAQSEEEGPDTPAAGLDATIKVGVCMPSAGSLAGLSKFQILGIRGAGDMFSERTGRNVELIFRETDGSARTFLNTVQKMLVDEHVSGIISCASDDEVDAARDLLARKPVPFIVTSPCTNTWRTGEGLREIRIGTTLEDQAYACARFLSHELKARRIGLIIDVDDPVAVKIGSLFSSELTRMPARIVGIAYVQKGKDPKASINRLAGTGPDAVYLPSAGDHHLAILEVVRSDDADRPVLIGSLPADETLSGKAGKALDGIYIQTDFIGDAVESAQGREFIEYYRRHAGSKACLGSGIATGAEGFFFIIDMISEARKSNADDALQAAASRKGLLLGFTGATPKCAVFTHLVFGRFERRFLGGVTVTFVAAITLNRSDPVADAWTQ